jgi:hypothetical protein
MATSIGKKIRRRGGAIRFRTAKHDGKLFRVAVTRKRGPRGGRTVEWEVPINRLFKSR